MWKKGLPTIPGYYWVYANDNEPPFIWEVDEDMTVFGMGDEVPKYYIKPRLFSRNTGTMEEINNYLWFGPIEIPKAPTAGEVRESN